jgi:UDP-4-amino-4,6-dideoxy-N-acetyl-beta-L-altrosamine N-acetyltransferase
MIKGKKIELHKPERDDMILLLEWRNNPDHRKYYREYRESTLEDQLNWYDNVMTKDDTWHHFIAKPIGVEKVIGVVFLNHIHPVYRTGEFGITLGDPNYRGKGFGKDMLLTILEYGFNELNLNRIWCEVYSNNESVHMYRKIGFKDEGVLRSHVYKNGEYIDSLILGMLKSEYNEIYK